MKRLLYNAYYSVKICILFSLFPSISLIFLAAIQGFMPVMIIVLTQKLIDELMKMINEGTNFNNVAIIFLIQICLSLVSYFIIQISAIVSEKLSIDVKLNVKQEVIQLFYSMKYKHFEDPSIYNIIDRIKNIDAELVICFKSSIELIRNICTFITILIYLAQISWLFIFLVTFCIIPLYIIQFKLTKEKYLMNRHLTEYSRKEYYISNLFQKKETLKELKLLNLGDYLLNKWKQNLLYESKKKIGLLIKESRYRFIPEMILSISVVISGLLCIYFIKIGKISIGSFVAVLQSIQSFQDTLESTSVTISNLYSNSLILDEYHQFKLRFSTDKDSRKKIKIEEIKQLRVESLSFQYPSNQNKSLKNINFEITKGKKIVIVGPNGSGKTSLIKCLVGLLDPSEGQVFINNHKLQDLDKDIFYSKLSVLFQDYVQYYFSVRDNIGMGNIRDIENQEKIEQAANSAGISDFIEQLPDKYETVLGKYFNKSQDLSGGQWQKIAIARLLIKNSDLLILDEPTSSLDPNSELQVLKEIFDHIENKSLIIISHRLGIAPFADEILYLKDGEIIEQGSHSYLMGIDKDYANLFREQAKLYTQKEDAHEKAIVL
ncbi:MULTISPECIES: ABC transporter ATP-binding protein [unclassified Sporosarcina]|uniref:ABC transporter ATP-binding protein n=1 Tax=unclassified Sporosarcina TaxID=2647733 RepID=UPI001A91CE37|nr:MULTISPECIES: ABC transporter ATP-binding protein [unclassified Sporosarcina]MBO0588351.1 ABC transporter ATP-binding protein [Sporosarcina sp. E16_8]MBO0603622.1 ABC transporter ATP-binding protein [Sporosarcina sp. E16_3]